jgi:hypothetical protein
VEAEGSARALPIATIAARSRPSPPRTIVIGGAVTRRLRTFDRQIGEMDPLRTAENVLAVDQSERALVTATPGRFIRAAPNLPYAGRFSPARKVR